MVLGGKAENKGTHLLRERSAAPRQGGRRIRTDAKAEGDLVTIGGYETFDQEGKAISKKEAMWFFLQLDSASVPWAFIKGEPFRTTSPLEMLGALMAIMFLLGTGAEGTRRWKVSLSAGGLTDKGTVSP